MIKWQQKDYLSLGRAVANFNKKINELNQEEKKLYLPELKNYKDIKGKIFTRQELNRVINSLRRFTNEGAEDPVYIKGNQIISKWEQQELGKQVKIAKRTLNKTISELEKPISFGYSRAQMGSEEYQETKAYLKSLEKAEKKLEKDAEKTHRLTDYTRGKGKAKYYENILENMRHLKNLELRQSGDFVRLKERIEKFGTLDYTYMKATIFRQNFEKALEESGAKNFANYEILKKKLNKITNPKNFFKFISQSNVLMDIFTYYKEGEGLVYGSFTSDEERFNYALEELELL